jgi:hypothetical protein
VSRQHYLEEAQKYHDQRWAQLMGRALSRRFVIKAGTIRALTFPEPIGSQAGWSEDVS